MAEKKVASVISKEDLDSLSKEGMNRIFPDKIKISVQMATCGIAAGADVIYNTIENEIKDKNIILDKTGCIGYCKREPMLNLFIPGFNPVVYSDLTPKKVLELLPEWLSGNIPKENALGQLDGDLYSWPDIKHKPATNIDSLMNHPFFIKQKKNILRNSGFINPLQITEYIGRGGYYTLLHVLKDISREDVVDIVTKSGLRGRGGAGFPTGIKWNICKNEKSDIKYVICNADEGDPGAYMDRTVLEGDPFSVLEGMTIGAYAIGAHKGYIYVRKEYPLAIEHLKSAIEQARNYGFLGNKIFGTEFSFDIEIFQGAGAFVCGEETGLLSSIEGKTGEPRPRPPYPAQKGLWGKPTNINNVKTWANIPLILRKGADWYRTIGTKKSTGTMIFSVVGKVKNTGLVEVPMGITLREIIFDIGGGIPNDKKFKAVQTGGPSGGCIPEDKLDTPVDYEELTKLGSMMGSGGMIVMDEDTCMVDVARYFLSFLVGESCGKCTPCREGVYQLYKIVDRITKGEGKEGDIELLEELAQTIKDASLCALGKTAPNPVLSTIRYFRDEYETHIIDKKCPAGVCTALFEYKIDPETCTACGICKKNCPVGAIEGEKNVAHVIIQEKCTKCGICYSVCPFDAIKKV